jgi:hypothetical protein
MRFASVLMMVACVAGFLPGAKGELSDKEQREAKKMVQEKLYLRIDAPCRYGSPGMFGSGLKTQTGAENGAEVETWFPRQESGALEGFDKPSRTGFPALLKFESGKLVIIEMTKSPELKLD